MIKMVDILSKLLIFVFIMMVISFFIILFFFLTNEEISDAIPFFDNDNQGSETSREGFDVGNDDLTINNESSNGVSAGGGSSGGFSDSGFFNNVNCVQNQISYSLTTLPKNTICLNFENEQCTQKEIICNAEIRSFDESVSGNFVIQFDLYDDTNISNIITTISASSFVNALAKKTISQSAIIAGENANVNISCQSNTLSVPYYEVCS